jgi:hypothetical protein
LHLKRIKAAATADTFLKTHMASEKKRQTLEKAQEVREKLRNRIGVLFPSAELIREDRDYGH